MSGTLQVEQVARIQKFLSSGQYADESAVVDAALDLLERQSQFHSLIQEGRDAIERGDVVDHDTVFREVRQRIAEIAADRNPRATP